MKNKTILVFDDDQAILDIFSIVLEAGGYKVEISSTSHDIIEKVAEIKPDAIIMDNWIPEIGGVEATRLLKSHPDFQQIPVIYCSANNDIESLASLAGAETYLSKPFDLDDLERKIADIIPS
ncbi:response regulator [Sphingobacterium wenxiniae]|uniref:Response regulator receiver domain-containing protein n=1 Tax=Sphingobacterium wenxiniae TaxID=683125 RepID=A0A1I6Q8R5_9SPHI|nr:response regulator [Sphingobacterium wenxiniae]SFS48735.1 Response regulator receiver domain-containing protein [Sphingobacterium wenxiniae]